MAARVVCFVSELVPTALFHTRYTQSIFNRLASSWTMGKIDTPHLTRGDPQPPLQNGLLRLYSMRFCPYAQRAILVLDAKNIPYDTVNANLSVKPEWLFEKSEGGKVPAIEFSDGSVLSESLIIAEYLNEAYPEPALYPSDPRSKAQDRLLIDKFSNTTSAFFKMLVSENGYSAENFEALIKTLETYEKTLEERATPFFGGSKPGMVDLMIWPWVERAPLLELKAGADFQLPKERLSKLVAWRDKMAADPAVKKSALPASVHRMFMDSRKKGVYDFDYDAHL